MAAPAPPSRRGGLSTIAPVLKEDHQGGGGPGGQLSNNGSPRGLHYSTPDTVVYSVCWTHCQFPPPSINGSVDPHTPPPPNTSPGLRHSLSTWLSPSASYPSHSSSPPVASSSSSPPPPAALGRHSPLLSYQATLIGRHHGLLCPGE